MFWSTHSVGLRAVVITRTYYHCAPAQLSCRKWLRPCLGLLSSCGVCMGPLPAPNHCPWAEDIVYCCNKGAEFWKVLSGLEWKGDPGGHHSSDVDACQRVDKIWPLESSLASMQPHTSRTKKFFLFLKKKKEKKRKEKTKQALGDTFFFKKKPQRDGPSIHGGEKIHPACAFYCTPSKPLLSKH